MLGLITAIVAVSASAGGYVKARQFVRRRLRYLDGIQSMKAPLIAGAVATAVAAPVVALLPLVGAGSALLFGTAVGLGTRRGAEDVREGRGGE